MVVGDLPFADDDVVRQNAAHRLVESAADGFFGNLELVPGLESSRVYFPHCLLDEVQRAAAA